MLSAVCIAAILWSQVHATSPTSDCATSSWGPSITGSPTGTSNFDSSAGSACACKTLSQLYPNNVLLQNSSLYTTETTHYWSARSDLSPKCVFTPPDDIAVAKGLLAFQTCKSQFAVRGAGHMPVVGAANTDGGVLMALSKLDKIQMGQGNTTVVSGAAQTWFGLASFLETCGKIVIGGRLKTIGISGLTLGGGLHYFVDKFGFPMDNVLEYAVAMSDGSVIKASNSSHTELFWALKGAGQSNFGVVTQFVFRTFDVPKVSTQIQIFQESSIPAFFKAVSDLAQLNEPEPIAAGGVFQITKDPNGNTTTVQMLGVQEGSSMTPSQLSNFTVLPSLRTINNISTYAEWTKPLDTPYQTSRYVFGSHSSSTDASNMLDMYNMYVDAIQELKGVAGVNPTFVVQPIGRGASAVSANNGIGNVWELDASLAYLFWEISTGWTDAKDDEKVLAWQKTTIEKIHSANKAKGLAQEFVYINDAADYQDPYSTLPAKSLARLATIRSRYDPTRIFSRLNTGGYSLRV